MKNFYLSRRYLVWHLLGIIIDFAALVLLFSTYVFCKLDIEWFNEFFGCEFALETPNYIYFFLIAIFSVIFFRVYMEFKSKFKFLNNSLPVIILSDRNLLIPLISPQPIEYSLLNKIEYVKGALFNKLILEAKSELHFSIKKKWYVTSIAAEKNKLVWNLPRLRKCQCDLADEIQKIQLN